MYYDRKRQHKLRRLEAERLFMTRVQKKGIRQLFEVS